MINYFSHSVIIDDIVFHDGRTLMGVLGGGGPQTAFGMKLWTQGGVGLCGGVGLDFLPAAQAWLDDMGIDTVGLRRDPEHRSLRAWQIIEEDGRRTQVMRSQGADQAGAGNYIDCDGNSVASPDSHARRSFTAFYALRNRSGFLKP